MAIHKDTATGSVAGVCPDVTALTDIRAVGAAQLGGLLLRGGAERLRLARLPRHAVSDILVLGILRRLRRRVLLVCLVRQPRSAVVLSLRTTSCCRTPWLGN